MTPMRRFRDAYASFLCLVLTGWTPAGWAEVVMNEIHYNPDVKTELVEFVELYNTGGAAVNLAGWSFSDGIQYTFGPNATIAPGGYLVVTEDTADFQVKFGFTALGPYEGNLDNDGERVTLRDAAGEIVDEVNYQLGFPWPTVGDPPGFSIELVHPSFDNDLAGNWRSSIVEDFNQLFDARLSARIGGDSTGRGPTPGARNAVHTDNVPPQIRQVAHTPEQPKAGETVRITAKVTDPEGVTGVGVLYQLVDPGAYIALEDAAYTNTWTTLPMNDAGTDGDELAGDGVYTAQLGGSVQVHRRLVRYRIQATDGSGATVRVPYPDDPQPNFAYFVYDGIPAWAARLRATDPPFTVSAAEMGRLPAIQLISKRSDVETGTWLEKYGGDAYKWRGTLVYLGQVYDHISYRARGGVWRYSMCKNMWKFRANRGHEIQAEDHWGREFSRRWTRLNLGASIQQGDYNHRGEQGMFESVGFRLFNLANLESPYTAFCTLRVVDAAEETPADQYNGDFWGVYLMVEQEDGRFLDEHGLPDGNLYKMENGTGPGNGELVNQGPNDVTDASDLVSFVNTYGGAAQSDQWYRDNLDLPRYYNYQAILQAIHHYDVCCGKNYYYYRNPATRRWEVHTWDLDLTWADNMYVAGVSGGTEPFRSKVLSDFAASPARPAIYREFQNRVREIRDLLFNTDQAFRVIDEHAELLRGTNGFPNILDADRAMWDYNPKMISATYTDNPTSKAGHGRFYQWPNEPTVSRDFNGCIQLMKNYVVNRSTVAALGAVSGGLDGLARDTAIPSTPIISPTGPPDFPANRLTFRVSNYSGVNAFAAWKWRIASITPTNAPAANPSAPNKYEIAPDWESPEITYAEMLDLTIPPGAVRVGQACRVRVRVQDTTGRWSHWSNPIEFVVGEPDSATALLAHLKVTELMYNSPAGVDFDFIELHNASPSQPLDLLGVKFTQGIEYTFSNSVIIEPDGYLVAVRTADLAAFRAHYGLGPETALAGPYLGNFANNGEQITLRTAVGGSDIVTFQYRDGRGWPMAADGGGHSMVPLARALGDQANGVLSCAGNWRASTFAKGSPGRVDPTRPSGPVLNEVVAHTDFATELDSNDWIELYNPAAQDFTFGPGWYLSDDVTFTNLTKWMIPAGTVLPAQGWISLDEQTGFHNPTNIGFGLNKGGEQVVLSCLPGTSDDRIVDSVSFKGQENGWSLGRFPDGGDFWFALTPQTRDGANAGPSPHVVISELMYHPPDRGGLDNTLDEFIELYNPTANEVALFNTNGTWRLDGGVTFSFPSNLVLAPLSYLLAANFDPADTARLEVFKGNYGITEPGLQVVGPYSGKLANDSERVALERPQAPDLPGDTLSWVIVDEVIYADQTPWQVAADGFGPSLHRQDALRPGNDPANWQAASPMAGGAYGGGVPPAITLQPTPASRTLRAGEIVSYSVEAEGTAPLQFQWLFNGNPMPGQNDPTLTLSDVQPVSSGAYSVLVMNPAGSAVSALVQLFVTTPPRIASHPASKAVSPGTTVVLTVFATGTGTLSYQWRFNGGDVPGANGASYLVENVQEEDDGTYTVAVSDINGTVISQPAVIRVLIPPSFIQHPVSQSVLVGGTVVFSVETAGVLPMGYRWRKTGGTSVVLPNVVLNSHQAFLVMTNVQPANAGSFSVVITNEASFAPGVQSRAAILTVLTDTDGDGMDDAWEASHGLDPNNPADAVLDADGDGLTNKQEYEAGTDAGDPESYLKVEDIVTDFAGTGAVDLRFLAVSNRTYTVQSRDTMLPVAWSRVADVVASVTNRVVQIIDQPGANVHRRYYRLVTPRIP